MEGRIKAGYMIKLCCKRLLLSLARQVANTFCKRNVSIFGIGDIGTVTALQNAGCKHLVLDDGDFDRLINSQKLDDEQRNKVLQVALENVANTIKNK
mgnify:FL=1